MKSPFFPTLPGGLIDPFYVIRKRILDAVKSNSVHISGKVLDFGCGSKPYQSLFKFDKYLGADIENPGHDHKNENIDIFFDGINLPLENETFDSCFSSEVFEHVFELDKVINEIKRVLKVGGKVVVTTPFVWDEHEVPHDFCRYTSYGLKSVFERNGLKVISITKYGSFLETIIQMLMLYFYRVTLKRRVTRVPFRFIVAPILNTLSLLSSLMPSGGSGLYLGQIVVAEKQ